MLRGSSYHKKCKNCEIPISVENKNQEKAQAHGGIGLATPAREAAPIQVSRVCLLLPTIPGRRPRWGPPNSRFLPPCCVPREPSDPWPAIICGAPPLGITLWRRLPPAAPQTYEIFAELQLSRDLGDTELQSEEDLDPVPGGTGCSGVSASAWRMCRVLTSDHGDRSAYRGERLRERKEGWKDRKRESPKRVSSPSGQSSGVRQPRKLCVLGQDILPL